MNRRDAVTLGSSKGLVRKIKVSWMIDVTDNVKTARIDRLWGNVRAQLTLRISGDHFKMKARLGLHHLEEMVPIYLRHSEVGSKVSNGVYSLPRAMTMSSSVTVHDGTVCAVDVTSSACSPVRRERRRLDAGR